MRASRLVILLSLGALAPDAGAGAQQSLTIAATRRSAAPVAAQRLAQSSGVFATAEDLDFVSMTVTGLALGAVGVIAGGYAGMGVDCLVSPGEWCGFVGAILGAVIGESILLPTGVWLVHGHGSPWRTIGTGVGIGLLGIAVTIATSTAFPANLLAIPAIPIVQLPVALAMEHRAAAQSGSGPPRGAHR